MKRWFIAIALVGLSGFGASGSNAKAPHPLLGGSLTSWVAGFGKWAPNTKDPVLGWFLCSGTAGPVRILTTVLGKHVIMVDGQNCDSSRMPSNAQNLVAGRAFFPLDAVSKGHITTDEGTDALFFSPSLAKTAQGKAQAVDCNGNPVKAGLFTFSANFDGGGDWQLAIGTCA